MTVVIETFTAGDSAQVEHDVTGVLTADPLIKAWFTVKTAPSVADPGSLQKVITTTAVQDVGQITEDGSELQGNGTASLIFQMTGAETATLSTTVRYYYDIQVKTASGKIYTSEVGRIQFQVGITDATT